MTLNSLRYDPATYREDLSQSTSGLSYLLNPIKYENCHKCSPGFGLVGGPDVSLDPTNMVDLESDLSGRTRVLSRAACGMYQPTCKSGKKCKKSHPGIPYDCDECQGKKLHVRTCNMIPYPDKIKTVGYKIEQPNCDDLKKMYNRSHIGFGPDSFSRMPGVQPYRPSSWQGSTGLAAYS